MILVLGDMSFLNLEAMLQIIGLVAMKKSGFSFFKILAIKKGIHPAYAASWMYLFFEKLYTFLLQCFNRSDLSVPPILINFRDISLLLFFTSKASAKFLITVSVPPIPFKYGTAIIAFFILIT